MQNEKIDLNNTKFVEMLLKANQQEKTYDLKRDSLNQHQEFILQTFINTKLIINTIDSLELNIQYILEFHPITNKKPFSDLTEQDIDKIKYHFENFYFRTSKVKDQILLLINHLFKLNLKNINCNYSNISKSLAKQIINKDENADQIRTLLITSIKSYKEKFMELNKLRNRLIHSTEYFEENFDMLKAILMFQDVEKSGKYEKGEFEIPLKKEESENLLKHILMENVLRFREINKHLTEWSYAFFEISSLEFRKIMN